MKTQILRIFISFIFLLIVYSNTLYAVTNENIEEFPKIETEEKAEVSNIEEQVTTNLPEENNIEEILPITYDGKIYVETPTNQENFIKQDNMDLGIKGWAVSTDSNASLRILIDENIVPTKFARNSRADVDALVSPAYGGVETTPKAGFSSIIDISNLSPEKHTLKIEQISRNGEIITSYETCINIANKKYEGKLYIENPTYQQNFTRPDDTKITIKGWAVSNDVNARLRLVVDGLILPNTMSRINREDVNILVSPEYGGIETTPKAGFSSSIDIENLTAGNHKIEVQEISDYGEIITSQEILINIANKKYQGKMYIENPTYNQNFTRPDDTKLTLRGWAVSEDSNADLKVFIDGNAVSANLSRTGRGDVDSLVSPPFGGTVTTPKAGFTGNIDISNLEAGKHTLKVEEISRFGDRIISQEIVINIVNKKYSGKLYIENPTYNQSFTRPDDTKLTLRGWAVSGDSNANLKVFIDGNLVASNLSRTGRGDVDTLVSPSFGGKAMTPKAGFNGTVDISNLGAGNHTLKVEEISRYGDVITFQEVLINIANKKYYGEMCVDTPTHNQAYNLGENITINGWAVSQDELATVEIYIDGNWKARADRYNRGDVVFYMNKYDGKTINAGFGKMINSSGMSAGTHYVTVYEKSRYGDMIGGVQIKITIKAPTTNNNAQSKPQSKNTNDSHLNNTNNILTSGTKGIDVSQFQGTIDWKKVANSGMKYAMIRIGYRGYGTGGFAEDTKFKTNFSNAVANGLKVGVYFYSTAINTQEAKADAEYVMCILKKYGYQNKVSMPIAIDLELIPGVNTRDKNVRKVTRTNIANTFCSTIAGYGYTPMVYACKSFLNSNMNASQISYDVWVAQYNSKCTYTGKYTMWQYTSSGKVSGITGNVDCNICYKNY